ncbi:hypothetical protein GCM10012275_54690 [Longimycelium tulufanense]|uniref:Uncharacterized protein n=1 Tax=Longimycelium tulufanense TaxID=907463 RepID=A0A8J3CKJ4_9PSEU|nr:hypothetical protein [Longimycelium tulufanense]GGM77105.1 hypothetical protein GCM10012275_54690 [Longimycelium tulufanense]
MTAACVVPHCGRPAPGAHLCPGCRDRLVADLRDIAKHHPDGQPSLIAELDTTLARLAKTTAGRSGVRSRNADTPLPYHPGAAEARYVLTNTITTWARDVAETNPHLTFTADSVEAAAAWLAQFPNLLAIHPAAAELHDEITSAAHLARRVIDHAVDTRIYLGRCGDIAGRHGCPGVVYARRRADTGTCDTCGDEHDVHTRRAAMLRALANRTITAADISTSLARLGIEISVDDIQRRAKAGVLKPATVDVHRRRSYRVGDVLRVFLGPDALTAA